MGNPLCLDTAELNPARALGRGAGAAVQGQPPVWLQQGAGGGGGSSGGAQWGCYREDLLGCNTVLLRLGEAPPCSSNRPLRGEGSQPCSFDQRAESREPMLQLEPVASSICLSPDCPHLGLQSARACDLLPRRCSFSPVMAPGGGTAVFPLRSAPRSAAPSQH